VHPNSQHNSEHRREPSACLEPHGEPVRAVEKRLRGSSYRALNGVSCACAGEVLYLRGRLPTYYLKQVAFSLASQSESRKVVNEIEVVTSGSG
jgi:hypothetical protein